MPTLQVDDGEPAESQTNRAGNVVPLVVWSTMVDSVRHGLYERGRHRRLTPEHQFAANTAHISTLYTPDWRSPPDRLHSQKPSQLLTTHVRNIGGILHARRMGQISLQV